MGLADRADQLKVARHGNRRRPHRALQRQPLRSDSLAVDLPHQRINRRPILGGLIYE
jgi:hypothetical protein